MSAQVEDQAHIVVLGGGPAGVGAAFQLRRLDRARVTVLERGASAGGNAASFELGNQFVDYGSHRLHPACDPAILTDIRGLMGEDLFDRPRHGRIRLRGRWIHFPLKPLDLLVRLDPGFAIGTMRDMVRKGLPGGPDEGDTFASVLRANLGPMICDHFYFPYARKIWGQEPEELSGIQARRRVSAGSFGKLLKKVLTAVPGLKPKGSGRFFYPRKGYGQISDVYSDAAIEAGADVQFRTEVTGLTRNGKTGWDVATRGPDGDRTISADWIWSTIPLTLLARMTNPAPPEAVIKATENISYRAMMLIYLQLPVDQFTEYDAHYFPGTDVSITRLSEPKNYSALGKPNGTTVVCAELPCDPSDEVWSMTDEDLGKLVADDLHRAGVPIPVAPVTVDVRRLKQAYPVYLSGYEKPFAVLDRWATALPRVLTYGRQGLFAHDNTHHALAMAYAAADCVDGHDFDEKKWAAYREVFATHVVED